jgi:uncharacterized protein (TIGR03437 family)
MKFYSTRHIAMAGFGAFVLVPLAALAYIADPPPRNTGAPGEDPAACAQCHNGANNPTSGSGFEVDFPNGLTYTPGTTQRLKVRLTTTLSSDGGFQFSVRPVSNVNQQAGNLVPVDGRTILSCQSGELPPCANPGAPVQFISHFIAGTQWEFDWVTPATSVGNVRVYVAANAANGNGSSSGDRIFLRNFTLTPAVTAPPAPQFRATQPVQQSFLGGARLSPGTWIELFGTNLAPSEKDWSGQFTANNTVAPTTVNTVSVTVDNKPAFIAFTSPGAVSAQVPDGIGLGAVPVVLTNANGRATATVTATATSPALYTRPEFNVGGVQYAAAIHSDNTTFVGRAGLVSGLTFRPAKPGDVIILYAVGCGTANPAAPAGTVVSGPLKLIPNVQVRFGQTVASAVTAALSPGSIGLCQLNVTVPNVANGDLDLDATINGTSTGQGLKITVQQ